MRWLVAGCVVFGACGAPAPAATTPVEPVAPAAPTPAPIVRGPGPLSTLVVPPQTPWPERQRRMKENDERKLDHAELRDDIAAFESVLHAFYPARTPEQEEAIRYALRHDSLLPGLAPYSVTSTFHALVASGQRLGICVRPPGETWPCDPPFTAPRPPARTPYTIIELAPGIAQLSVTELRDAEHPAWESFDDAVRALESARGLVVDLRGAVGSDPRPLVPWLEQLTGNQPLQPLRAIVRPQAADEHVAAYEARYLPEGRDRAVWGQLVGETPTPAARNPRRPIVVLVDGHCGPACELVARVLEAYAGADVIGNVPTSRLHRDEAALVTLPHSKIDVLFHATEYLLAEDIEAATGPTHAWRSRTLDAPSKGYSADALRLVMLRLQHPAGLPRCDGVRAYATRKAMPEPFRSKISEEHDLDPKVCRTGHRIEVETTVPPSVFQRHLATCGAPVSVAGGAVGNRMMLDVPPGVGSFRVLSQLAQSELVRSIRIECDLPAHPT